MPAHEPEDRSDAYPTRGERGGRTLRFAAIGGLAVLVLAAGGVALALTVFSGDDGDAQAQYRDKLDTAMADVVTANRSLSNALGRLRSRPSTSAERAVARAQSATASARGAVNALTVPSGSERLATNARQTLSRQATYLAAVKAALSDPRGPSAGQTQTLAGNLTDAFDIVAPPDADWSQSVSGADNLTAWSQRNVRAAARTRQRRAAKRRSHAPGGAPTAPAPSNGSDCDGGLRAGPNTSCAFAANVKAAYHEAPGSAATIEVYSPTTGRTYTMSCSPAGSGVTCSGGNDASVSF